MGMGWEWDNIMWGWDDFTEMGSLVHPRVNLYARVNRQTRRFTAVKLRNQNTCNFYINVDSCEVATNGGNRRAKTNR